MKPITDRYIMRVKNLFWILWALLIAMALIFGCSEAKAIVHTNQPVFKPIYCEGDTLTLSFYMTGNYVTSSGYHYAFYMSNVPPFPVGNSIGNYAPDSSGLLKKFSQLNPGTITCIIPFGTVGVNYIGVALIDSLGKVVGPFKPSSGHPIRINDCCTSVGEYNEFYFDVYPNPATTEINISKEAMVNIYDNSGKLILSDENTKFDVSRFPSGNYMLNINVEGVIINRKIIIIR